MAGNLNIEFTIHIRKQANYFIAHAMPLDVMSSGNIPEEAKRALDEAVHLLVQTASDMGTLEEILEECGYQCDNGTCMAPTRIAVERHISMIGLG